MNDFLMNDGAVDKNKPEDGFITVKMLITALGVAVLAGFLAWGLAENFRVVEVVQFTGKFGGAELSVPFATRNGEVAYATLGGLLGLGLGVTAGLMFAQRSKYRLMLGGLTGALLGSIGGLASAYVLFPTYFNNMEQSDLTISLLIHLGIWIVLGAAAGFAFGVGSGSRQTIARSLTGGITGAALGTLLFDLTGAFLPLAHTERPLSQEAGTRLVANILLGVCIAMGVVIVAAQKPRIITNKP